MGAICANGDKNGANCNPLVPMAMDLMAPMVRPIAIGTNGDRYWSHWGSPLVIAIGNYLHHLNGDNSAIKW